MPCVFCKFLVGLIWSQRFTWLWLNTFPRIYFARVRSVLNNAALEFQFLPYFFQATWVWPSTWSHTTIDTTWSASRSRWTRTSSRFRRRLTSRSTSPSTTRPMIARISSKSEKKTAKSFPFSGVKIVCDTLKCHFQLPRLLYFSAWTPSVPIYPKFWTKTVFV